jgi:hypothetical protein
MQPYLPLPGAGLTNSSLQWRAANELWKADDYRKGFSVDCRSFNCEVLVSSGV